MDVRICGPNLYDQSKGSLHVHRANCNDLNYYGPGRRYGGDHRGPQETLIRKATIRDIVYAVYDNGILEEGVSNGDAETMDELAKQYVSEFWFAPCCGTLPGGWSEEEV